MFKKLFTLYCGLVMAGTAHAAVVVTTSKSSSQPFAPVLTDLTQTQFSSASATGGSQVASNPEDLFDGIYNDGTTGAGAGITMDSGNTFTINFDISTNTLGYDITQIDTIFAWSPAGGGRSNQGYSIELGFVGGGSAFLANAQHWEPNSPSDRWTLVSFANSGGGTLFSDTINLNGGGASAGTSVLATGVSSITFDITNSANASGVIVGQEVDIYGTATVPEPSTFALLVLGLGSLALARRRKA